MAVKTKKMLIRMVSTGKTESGSDTGTFYVKRINPKRLGGKMEYMKYDKRIRKHVLFVEKKIK